MKHHVESFNNHHGASWTHLPINPFPRLRIGAVPFFFLLLLVIILPAQAESLDLRELIREIEEQHTGLSSHATMIMEVKTEHWERSVTMEAWSLGRDYFLARILAPPKERGTSTLKAGKDVWNYLPKVDRVIKIPPSLMGGAWMGSHITNDDLVKASRVDEDYDFTLLFEDESLWRIEGIPKPEAAVVWGKIVYEVLKEGKVPKVVIYFDEAMKEVRRITFDKARVIGKRTIPLRMTVLPLEDPDEKTVLEYNDIVFDIAIESTFFSLKELKGR